MYRINVPVNNDMEKIETVSLSQVEMKEREHLQELIAKHPECLCDDRNNDDKLLIIQKEFSSWDDQSRMRLDLLALDKQGNLVVIENKRDDSPYNVVAQAITYASFCETMTAKRIIDEYANYHHEDVESAKEKICKFLDEQEIEDININRQQRIIIVAGDFPMEVTSAVLWLTNNYDLKIDCVRYQLYRDGEALYVDFDKIIPIAGTEEYQVKLAEKRREENESRCICAEYRDYWIKVISYLERNKVFEEEEFHPNDRAEKGKQSFRINVSKKPYFFRLRLYKDGAVGVSVSIMTNNDRGEDFYEQISTPEMKQRINNALGGEEKVHWGEKTEKTISTTDSWNKDNPEESIAWQMNTLVAVKKILDEVSI